MCQFGVLMEINDSALVESAVTNSEEITGILFLEDGGERFVCMMLLCCDLCWRRGIWLGVTRGKWRIWFSHSDLQCGKFCRKSSENGSENQSFNRIASSKSESGHLTVKANKCNHRDQRISKKYFYKSKNICACLKNILSSVSPESRTLGGLVAGPGTGSRPLAERRRGMGETAVVRSLEPVTSLQTNTRYFPTFIWYFQKKTFEVEIRFPWKWNKMSSFCFSGLRLIMFS